VVAAPTNGGDETLNAIKALRDQIETNEKRQDFLLRKLQEHEKQAKQYVQQKKVREAKLALQRKKMCSDEIDKLTSAAMGLEKQKNALEGIKINKDNMLALDAANKAMKTEMQQLGVDKVDEIVDDARELLQDVSEIGDRLAEMGQGDNDDELQDELDALMAGDAAEDLTSAAENLEDLTAVEMPSAPMPSVPQAKAETAMTDEDRELAELEASMGAMG